MALFICEYEKKLLFEKKYQFMAARNVIRYLLSSKNRFKREIVKQRIEIQLPY